MPSRVAFIASFGLSALFALLARLWTRFVIIRNWGADDVTIVLSMGFAIVVNVCSSLQYEVFKSDSIPDQVHALLCYFLVRVGGLFSASLTKISIILFYKRVLARSSSPKVQRVMTGCISFVAFYTIVIGAVNICTCRPIGSYWLSSYPNYGYSTCYNDAYGNVSSSVVGALTDIMVILLPTLFLRGLVLHRRQKLALYAIFGLGIFTCAAAIARTVYTVMESIAETSSANNDWDNSVFKQQNDWIVAEVDGGIVCACVPALKPLFHKIMQSNGSVWQSNKSPNRGMYGGSSSAKIWRSGHFKSSNGIELGDIEEGFESAPSDGVTHNSQTALTEHAETKVPAGAIEKKVVIDVIHSPS